jgi:N-acetylmuramoyl-L-alanine amidase
MTAPGKLQVDTVTGHVTGPARILFSSPFPVPNGGWGSGPMMGVVMHTEVGDNPGTESWFENPAAQASADFAVAQDGSVIQMGPVGKGWVAWAEAGGNRAWYSIEHADDGNPANPLTAAQITASAQLVEVLSRFAGFPLQVSDSTSVKGYGWHGMGGQAWGGHPDCPGDVRKAQRAQIIALAMAIRSGGQPAPSVREWVTGGEFSLAQLAAQQKCDVATILHLTAEHGPYGQAVADLINGVFAGTVHPFAPMPAGLKLYVPA